MLKWAKKGNGDQVCGVALCLSVWEQHYKLQDRGTGTCSWLPSAERPLRRVCAHRPTSCLSAHGVPDSLRGGLWNRLWNAGRGFSP